MEKILKLFSYSMILAIAINMMSPLMIYAAAKPLPVNDYPTSSSAMSQVEMQKQLAVEQKKAQEEMYKAMGLSTAEVEYLEKNDFEAIKNRLDKYVTYDKDGYAKMAKITSAQSRKDGISSREISIGMKMVANYNETVKNISNQVTKDVKTTKSILDRGIEVRNEIDTTKLSRASTNTCRTFEWVSSGFTWYGFYFDGKISKCGLDVLNRNYDTATNSMVLVSTACSMGIITAPICGWPASVIAGMIKVSKWSLNSYSSWFCRSQGVAIHYRVTWVATIMGGWFSC